MLSDTKNKYEFDGYRGVRIQQKFLKLIEKFDSKGNYRTHQKYVLIKSMWYLYS